MAVSDINRGTGDARSASTGAQFLTLAMKRNIRHLSLAFVSLTVLSFNDCDGQAKIRKLSTIINHPSINVFAPFISTDANALVFLSDNAEDHVLTPFFSFRVRGDWQEPQVLPKAVNTRLNFLRGYGLSADGNTLYFTTMKSPGVGGFDIWASEWRGTTWANPVNLGGPVNSKAHDACPSVTPDGRTMYFMRCDKMTTTGAEQCKIFKIAKKSNGQWDEAVELPDYINTGNSQAPRIMADSETLIFSSDRMDGGKGGMDLFMTRFHDGSWTRPVALDFANTEKDDQYVSVTGLGRYLLRDSPGARKSELVEYLIPGPLRPGGMMKIDGNVSDNDGKPLQAYVSLIDLKNGQRVFNGRPNSDGSFLLYAREGSKYELAVDPEHGNETYYTKILDLTAGDIPQVEKVEVTLKPLVADDELVLGNVRFRENSGELDLDSSDRELRRFVRMATSNPGLGFEIQVLFEGYAEDSLQSSPDLTEIRLDTISSVYVDIDTLGQLFERDTIKVNVTYHNDRTPQQLQSIISYLTSHGVDGGNLTGYVSAQPAVIPGTRRTVVKAKVVKM